MSSNASRGSSFVTRGRGAPPTISSNLRQCFVAHLSCIYTYSTPILHLFYTYSTPILHLFYTYSTPILHLFYTYSTPILHLFYTCMLNEIPANPGMATPTRLLFATFLSAQGIQRFRILLDDTVHDLQGEAGGGRETKGAHGCV